MSSEPTYTPTKDIHEEKKDGSGSVLVASAGKPMTWARALMLGLVKTDEPRGTQTVVAAPAKKAPDAPPD